MSTLSGSGVEVRGVEKGEMREGGGGLLSRLLDGRAKSENLCGGEGGWAERVGEAWAGRSRRARDMDVIVIAYLLCEIGFYRSLSRQ